MGGRIPPSLLEHKIVANECEDFPASLVGRSVCSYRKESREGWCGVFRQMSMLSLRVGVLAHAVLLRDRLRSTAVAVVPAGLDGVLGQQQNGLEEDGWVQVQRRQGTEGTTSGLCWSRCWLRRGRGSSKCGGRRCCSLCRRTAGCWHQSCGFSLRR